MSEGQSVKEFMRLRDIVEHLAGKVAPEEIDKINAAIDNARKQADQCLADIKGCDEQSKELHAKCGEKSLDDDPGQTVEYVKQQMQILRKYNETSSKLYQIQEEFYEKFFGSVNRVLGSWSLYTLVRLSDVAAIVSPLARISGKGNGTEKKDAET